jgi:hypothetical protein
MRDMLRLYCLTATTFTSLDLPVAENTSFFENFQAVPNDFKTLYYFNIYLAVLSKRVRITARFILSKPLACSSAMINFLLIEHGVYSTHQKEEIDSSPSS